MCQPFNDLGTPTLLSLACQDVHANLPVQPHQFPVDCQCGALLGAMDAPLQIVQPVSVTVGCWGQ